MNVLSSTAEHDRRFREYVARLAWPGLRILGMVEIAVPVVLYFGQLATDAATANTGAVVVPAAGAAAVGFGTLALGLRRARNNGRFLSGLSAVLAAAILIWASLLTGAGNYRADDYIPAGIALVLLASVAVVPFTPPQTILIGLGIYAMYAGASIAAARYGVPPVTHGAAHHVFLLLLTALAAGISAANYQDRLHDFRAQQDAVRVAEALTGAQLRAQLAESAVSIGKMAAALTHELTNPMATLKSSTDTLLALEARRRGAPAEKLALIDQMQEGLRDSIRESAERVEDVIARLRRFVSMEDAEIKAADLNELLSDVALLYADQIRDKRVHLDFDLRPLGTIQCRPQLISAVFSNLLSNAINAVNGDGRIDVATRKDEDKVEVTITDNGRGIPPEELDDIFDPSFKTSGHRVASANWSLFNTRQILYEHGGDIRIESRPGTGTKIQVILPTA